MVKFRFQDLKIWQLAIQIADALLGIADSLEQKRLYRFAEQLRGASMSMSNNISEGSGSVSKKEFKQFLNVAPRSTFENANNLILLQRRNLITLRMFGRSFDQVGSSLSTNYQFSEFYEIESPHALCPLPKESLSVNHYFSHLWSDRG